MYSITDWTGLLRYSLNGLFICSSYKLEYLNDDALICVWMSKHFLVIWDLSKVATIEKIKMQLDIVMSPPASVVAYYKS